MAKSSSAAITEFWAILEYQRSCFLSSLLIKYKRVHMITHASKKVKNKEIAKPAFLIRLASRVANLKERGAYLSSY